MLQFKSRLINVAKKSSRRRVLRLELLEGRNVLSTLVVTNNLDTGVPGDGSLRGEIAQAESGDAIRFAGKLAGQTITLTQGELAVTKNLTIIGLGADELTVSGNGESRVFDIGSGANVSISGLTISNGLAASGAGILNAGGTLTLSHDKLADNKAVAAASQGGANGGGVANRGMLTVVDSTFTDNQALGPNGASRPLFPGLGIGGGIWNGLSGTVSVVDSRFSDNVAQGGSNCSGTFAGLGQGGAIYNDNVLTVAGTEFGGNKALGGSDNSGSAFTGEGVGGAISSGTQEALTGNTNSAVLTVGKCTFTDNRAVGGNNNTVASPSLATGPSDGFGGGIFVFQGAGDPEQVNATISLSVLDNNEAHGGTGGGSQYGSNGIGGGIFFFDFIGGVTANVTGCAIVQNKAIGGDAGASGGPGGDGAGGGLAAGALKTGSSNLGTVEVTDALVAGNLAQGGQGGSGANGGNAQGGGVYNDAQSTLTLSDSILMFNQAIGGSGGAGGNGSNGQGGGLYNGGVANLSASIIVFNSAAGGAAGSGGVAGLGQGGGVYNNAAANATVYLDKLMFIFGNTPDNRFGF